MQPSLHNSTASIEIPSSLHEKRISHQFNTASGGRKKSRIMALLRTSMGQSIIIKYVSKDLKPNDSFEIITIFYKVTATVEF